MGDVLSFKAFLSLASVLAVLLGAVWFLKRGVFHLAALKRRSPIQVETAASLGERRSLAIVSVEGRRLLIGLTPSAVSFISDLGVAPMPAREDGDA